MIGKILGGIIGAVCAGPWGAVIGATIGHYSVDAMKDAPAASGGASANFSSPLVLICEAAAKIAKAKGVITRAEIDELEQIFAELNLSPESRKKAIYYFRSAKNSPRKIESIAAEFAEKFPSAESRQAFLQILLRIALSDGSMQAEEFEALKKTCRALGLDPSILSGFYSGGQRRAQGSSAGSNSSSSNSRSSYSGSRAGPYTAYSQELAEACAVLGVKPGAPLDEIKSVYRKKCKDLHPDVLRSKGLGEFAMKAIEAELVRVNEAYDKIMKSRR